ncbi:hypothetical protein ACF07D_07630 [Leucobacter sp. NPDC015123]|uniref:hypothetical protein n=1 Tax=Leucobacter sp. NPDC015123 TaxID=3364129 RepID=UPI0036F4515F
MFKKKRNALLEEMREIAENETVRVLESAGLISEHVRVIGPGGVRSRYVAKPAEDHAARALAEEARAAAEEALEAAGVARAEAAMALEREAAEAYLAAKEAEAEVDAAAAEVARGQGWGGRHRSHAGGTRRPESLSGELPESVSKSGDGLGQALEGGLLGAIVREVFDDRRCSRDRFACAGDLFSDLFEALGDARLCTHVSSPVVAESEAGTSDAPAMTVQEGGSSDAAPGVEGVSPASSTPRFVVLGALVYDRDANKAVSCTSPAAARSVADELNAGYGQTAGFYWESAK